MNLGVSNNTVRLETREAEVLYLIAAKFSNLRIGTELDVSGRTVGRWCISLYEKIGVTTREEAIIKGKKFLGKHSN